MVPRSSRYRGNKKKIRKRMFKNFSSSFAISSLILGSAQLVTPTYSEFNSINEQEIDIKACFIFPQTIEDIKEKTSLLHQEAVAFKEDALSQAANVNIDSVMGGIDSYKESIANKDQTPTDNFTGDTNTIEGLQALQNNLQAELSSIQNTITSNEEGMNKLQVITTELNDLLIQTESIITDVFPNAIVESEDRLIEIIKFIQFIEDYMNRAIEECNFSQEYFNEILNEMEIYKLGTEEVITELENGLLQMEDQRALLNDKVGEVDALILNLQSINDSLSARIADIENQLAVISEQIAVLVEIQHMKEDLLAGTDLLTLYLQNSEMLTEEQMQQLLDKLAGIIEKIGTIHPDKKFEIENAIADIEKEIKQLEEETLLERERLKKEEEELLKNKEQEGLEQEEGMEEETELEQNEDDLGEDDKEDEGLQEEDKENLEKEIGDNEDDENLQEEVKEEEQLTDEGEQELGKEESGEGAGNEQNKDKNNNTNEGQTKSEESHANKENQENLNEKEKPEQKPQKLNQQKTTEEAIHTNKEQARKENDQLNLKISSILLGLQESSDPYKETGKDQHPQIKEEIRPAFRSEITYDA